LYQSWLLPYYYLFLDTGFFLYLNSSWINETRFWISQQVADKKNTNDNQRLFREGKQRAGKKPYVLISDGAANFRVGYKKEFFA
jgi:hypothetical protein